ncbi:unnamed protein product [Caenorhabditis auriculariae]|uniref:DUF38 domain-containing protein n=1 Tax=Caenorhabditis auriculariae TaxID=2777116 RepID=A0A8S1HZK3_9PELO|nr:unnamed protein product [Caenorhabditis auriculariae]
MRTLVLLQLLLAVGVAARQLGDAQFNGRIFCHGNPLEFTAVSLITDSDEVVDHYLDLARTNEDGRFSAFTRFNGKLTNLRLSIKHTCEVRRLIKKCEIPYLRTVVALNGTKLASEFNEEELRIELFDYVEETTRHWSQLVGKAKADIDGFFEIDFSQLLSEGSPFLLKKLELQIRHQCCLPGIYNFPCAIPIQNTVIPFELLEDNPSFMRKIDLGHPDIRMHTRKTCTE